ncbi:hypothetical protein KFL_003380130 [Klebsormidium nitens]|uniref:Dirigent protein n=1 Tax=Klebsormidium nitens TaxID=105231 RepID=A0A1Y1IGD9_KLENI|nr:hypothetical protein KFL_003380130 [Klebsormidium nitens]|eukprot:GAQ87208.1 hypothetical protein KFL_003380130 [Klebsormidium nitens]
MAAGKFALVLLTVALVACGSAEAGTSRLLLQSNCVPGSSNPNACYNAPGTAFTCCPGSCTNNPGPTPACLNAAPTGTTPAPTSPPVNVTQTGGPPLPKPNRTPTLTFIEVATPASTTTYGDINARGATVFYRNKVLDTLGGSQIGFTTQIVRQSIGPNEVPFGNFEQDTLYYLEIGSSTVFADGLFSQQTSATLAIIGGTGDFSFAQGTIVVDRAGTDSAGNVLFKGALYLP